MEEKHYDFFQNKLCEFYPCHPGADPETFSCLFCYNAGSSYGSGNSYGSGGYSAPAAPSYAAPASAPASDFAMLEDDDAQLPF